jgi:BlaI family transcriptional regulator, penicillinase repressor
VARNAVTERDLSDAEWEIMKVLWRDGAMALGEICAKLPDGEKWAYSTVRTFVSRMVDKGWVSARRVGSSHLYAPVAPKRRAVGTAVREFTQRVLDGVMTPFVAYYAEDKGLSDAEIAELEEIIEEHRKKKGGKK